MTTYLKRLRLEPDFKSNYWLASSLIYAGKSFYAVGDDTHLLEATTSPSACSIQMEKYSRIFVTHLLTTRNINFYQFFWNLLSCDNL